MNDDKYKPYLWYKEMCEMHPHMTNLTTYLGIQKPYIHWHNPHYKPHLTEGDIQKFKPRDWSLLCDNPNDWAIEILERNVNKIRWGSLVENTNPKSIPLIKKILHELNDNCWSGLFQNPNAWEIIEQNLWRENCIPSLSFNPHPRAIAYLEQHPDNIAWKYLSNNPSAVHLIKQNMDKIDWGFLSMNENAVDILERNNDKIIWYMIWRNKNAIHLIEEFIVKESKKMGINNISWECLATNPNAFPLWSKYVTPDSEAFTIRNLYHFSQNPCLIPLVE